MILTATEKNGIAQAIAAQLEGQITVVDPEAVQGTAVRLQVYGNAFGTEYMELQVTMRREPYTPGER